ncbi:hypothetical protein V1512DRAFT_267359 [Lipomyces arxii]|uniref:uncharacterized protein n=1 Tax=Lipomyces arxii TaxID=56418 RepID=UPI0034CDE2D4
MPWRYFLQNYLTKKLLESESFHKTVRAVHRTVNDAPAVSKELKQQASENMKLRKAVKFTEIIFEEMKDAIRGKPPPKS